jgi:cysteine synthase A
MAGTVEASRMADRTTPLIEIDGVFAKLECLNPTGSIKYRVARHILTRSRELGLLKPGQPIIEATSGNTGIAITEIGKKLGHPVTIVMPENMTEERKDIIRAIGAELVLCSENGSFAEAAQIRDQLAAANGWFNPDQFSNPLNVECHQLETGSELIDQMRGRRVDAFVAGVGTGGTLIGIGAALRSHQGSCQIVAVEPSESPVMSGGKAGPHVIFGIGDGFIPAIASDGRGGIHPGVDDVMLVSGEEALAAAHDLRERHGLCVGISSGANFLAATRLRERYSAVATVFADGYPKYRTHGLCSSNGRCAFVDVCESQNAVFANGLSNFL